MQYSIFKYNDYYNSINKYSYLSQIKNKLTFKKYQTSLNKQTRKLNLSYFVFI